jgi:hypothetical protein
MLAPIHARGGIDERISSDLLKSLTLRLTGIFDSSLGNQGSDILDLLEPNGDPP